MGTQRGSLIPQSVVGMQRGSWTLEVVPVSHGASSTCVPSEASLLSDTEGPGCVHAKASPPQFPGSMSILKDVLSALGKSKGEVRGRLRGVRAGVVRPGGSPGRYRVAPRDRPGGPSPLQTPACSLKLALSE